MSRGLTPRQQECLQIIEDSLRDRGVSPSIREIGRALGVVSTSGVSEHLRALQKKGYLRRHDLIARGLIPLAPPGLIRAPASNDGTHGVAPPALPEDTARLADELRELRGHVAEIRAQLEDAQGTIGRKERRIERLEMLLAETRLALHEANLTPVRG